ncbi:hypothetical protein [Streptomyces canus]|uniref:hypothetical protein n=1 Tax=Streptomyces canus TaxID=58343 RepID=UPI00387010E6|nr:hypothetical protein OH824_17925 [Streptomyces canus]
MSLFIHRNAGGRCPCGAENATCGPPSGVVPVDQLIEEVPAVSGPLKKYKVTRGGVETVMKLSDDDAKRLGASPDDVVGGVSTIQPVQPVQPVREGEADDGPADDGGAGSTTPGDDEGGQGAQQVQQAADSGGDVQAPSPTAAATDDQQAPAAPAPAPAQKTVAKKTAAKRQPTSANKARTGAETKAADGGS